MSISIVPVIVPAAGDGPVASIANLVGAKTVELSGTFTGRYVLLGSQNGANFVPVAFFDSDGKESIKVTLELALSQVRVRSKAVGAANVTMNVSGVLQVGGNQLTTIASIPAGSSGQQAVVDLYAVFPPTGVEQDICFLCEGSFSGMIVVEGSMDGVNFNPIGNGFGTGSRPPSLLGSNPPLEFSPLTTKTLVRYLRITLTGVAYSQVVVTFGGSNPAAGGGSPTVPIPLLIATVGGEGPPSVTYQGAGTVVGTTIGVATVVAGDGNTLSGLGNDNSVVVGSGISLGNSVANVVASGASIAVRDGNSYLTVLGQLISVGSNSSGAVVLGASVAVGAGNLAAVVINGTLGDNAGNSILIGQSTIGSVGGKRAAANFLAGTGSTITDGSVNVIVIGNACTAGIGTFVAASDGAVIIGVGSNVGSNSSATVVAGYNASIGASSSFAVAVHGTIGDHAKNSIVLGQSTIGSVGGTRAAANFIAGTGSSIADGSVNVTVIGNANSVVSSDASVLIGTSASIATACSFAIALGSGTTIAASSTAAVSILGTTGTLSPFSTNIHGTLGDHAEDSILIGRSNLGTTGGARAADNILIGTGSTIGDGSVYATLIGGNSTLTSSDYAIIVGYGASIATTSPLAVALGNRAAIGSSSQAAVSILGTIGDTAQNSMVIGQSTIGTVGGTRSQANFVAGTGSTITDNSVNTTVIGNANTSTQSDAVVIVGTSSSVGATSSASVVLGNGAHVGTLSAGAFSVSGTIGNHATNSILIGQSIIGSVGGARASGNILVGVGSTIFDGSVNATVVGNASTVTSSDGAVVVGTSSSIATTSPNAMALGSSAAVGSSSQSAVAVLASTGNSSPFSLNVGGIVGTGNASVVCLLGQLGNNCAGSVAVGTGNSMGPGSDHSVVVGSGNSVGDLTHGAYGFVFGAESSISNNARQGLALGQNCTATGDCGIAIGSFATAGANQCVIGNGQFHALNASIDDFTVYGSVGGVAVYTLRAVDNPTSGLTGLTLVYNNGVVTTNKNVKAAAVPSGGSLLLYMDP